MSQPVTPLATPPSTPGPVDASLHGRSLLIARAAWVVLTFFILALNIVMLPRYAAVLQSPCQPGVPCFAFHLTAGDQRLLHQMNLSLGFLAGYQVALDASAVFIYCALGALLFWRKSADRMALFCAFTLVLFGGASFTGIIQDTLVLVSPAWFALIGILDVLGQTSFLVFFFLFPSGRFAPRWTRWIALCASAYWIYEVFFVTSITNQNGDTPDNLVLFALLLCAVIGQMYRYRRVSTPRERQQTKWVVFGFATGIVGFVLLIGIGTLLLPPAVINSAVVGTFVAHTAIYGFLLLIPISMAIAILRSRLWDIDTIINKTLVYGLLTAILGGLYAGLVLGLASRISEEPVVIVIATLAIAALFQPLRKRLQNSIDRRFYRRKYDAAKTLAAFSATLRQEIDLNDLREHLLAVVHDTMQPAQVSLWLRSPEKNHESDAAP
jgi:hypothetical protein